MHLVQVLIERHVLLLVDHEHQLHITRLSVRVVGPTNNFRRSLMLRKEQEQSDNEFVRLAR